jgi:hypothetical protein
MLAIAIALALGQAPCPPGAVALMAEATSRAGEFDVAGGAERMERAAAGGCERAHVASLYLRGLLATRDAFRQGAPPETLASVRDAIAELERISGRQPGQPEISRLILQAAAAGAQSERDEMALYLEHAIQMEALQRAAGQPGAPVLGALEVAGDLWLQVFRYEDARRMYQRAMAGGDATMRALAGLARTAARLKIEAAACEEYRTLLDRWGTRDGEPPEIAEARTYVGQCERH